MDKSAADRIIELAAKWQQKVEWEFAYGQAGDFKKYRHSASKDREAFQLQWTALLKAREPDAAASRFFVRSDEDWKFLHDHLESNPEGMLALFQHGAERDEELSEMAHKQVVAAHQEFCDMMNLARTHAPTLLEFVPNPNFFFDDANTDRSSAIRDLAKLEGLVRDAIKPKPSPALTREKWIELLKMSLKTFERRIDEGAFTVLSNERGRWVLDINTLPLEMQSTPFSPGP